MAYTITEAQDLYFEINGQMKKNWKKIHIDYIYNNIPVYNRYSWISLPYWAIFSTVLESIGHSLHMIDWLLQYRTVGIKLMKLKAKFIEGSYKCIWKFWNSFTAGLPMSFKEKKVFKKDHLKKKKKG